MPSLRDWLTRKQKETRRGRAELLLQERREAWERGRHNRLLPSPSEVGRILLWTRREGRTTADRQMLRRALWVHSRRLAAALSVVVAVAFLAVAVVHLAYPPPLEVFVERERTPLEVFLDRAATVETRLNTIPSLPLDDAGAMAQIHLGLRGT